MAGEALQRQPQHELGRARRPLPLPLDGLQALQEAADVDEHARKLRTDLLHRAVEAEPRGERHVGQIRHAAGAAAAARH